MDFTEIMNFCGYDLARADAMVKEYADAVEEALSDVGLEALHQQSVRENRGRLCSPNDKRRAGIDMV